jgi:hypothetical protein
MNQDYNVKKIYMVMMISTLILCINYGIYGVSSYNIMEIVTNKLNYGDIPLRIICAIIGICALYLITNRNTYLPFLGDCVFPDGVLNEKTPTNYNTEIKIKTKPYTKIVYWGAEEKEFTNVIDYPDKAYGNYTNAGVTIANGDGIAYLKMRQPRQYKTPSGKVLKPHVHYREYEYPGMLSSVSTINI